MTGGLPRPPVGDAPAGRRSHRFVGVTQTCHRQLAPVDPRRSPWSRPVTGVICAVSGVFCPATLLDMSWTRIGAYAVCTDAESRLLVCRIAPGYPSAGEWTLPGGGVEVGEDPNLAVLRELGEESGLLGRVESISAIESYVVERPVTRPGPMHAVAILYRVEVTGGGLPGTRSMVRATAAHGWRPTSLTWCPPSPIRGPRPEAGARTLARPSLRGAHQVDVSPLWGSECAGRGRSSHETAPNVRAMHRESRVIALVMHHAHAWGGMRGPARPSQPRTRPASARARITGTGGTRSRHRSASAATASATLQASTKATRASSTSTATSSPSAAAFTPSSAAPSTRDARRRAIQGWLTPTSTNEGRKMPTVAATAPGTPARGIRQTSRS